MAFDIDEACEDIVESLIDLFEDAKHTRTKKEFKDSMSLVYTAAIGSMTNGLSISDYEESVIRRWKRRFLDEADEWYEDNIASQRDDDDDDDDY